MRLSFATIRDMHQQVHWLASYTISRTEVGVRKLKNTTVQMAHVPDARRAWYSFSAERRVNPSPHHQVHGVFPELSVGDKGSSYPYLCTSKVISSRGRAGHESAKPPRQPPIVENPRVRHEEGTHDSGIHCPHALRQIANGHRA